MQVAEAAVLESPVMTERKPDRRGVATREAILRALRERHDGELAPPSLRELALEVQRHWTTVADHVSTLQADGLVTHGYGAIALTPAGLRASERFARRA